MCIYIVENGLGLLMGRFCQVLTELSARLKVVARYYRLTFLLTYLYEITGSAALASHFKVSRQNFFSDLNASGQISSVFDSYLPASW